MLPFDALRRLVPKATRRRLLRWTRRPAVGRVDFGQLRRLKPVSNDWGGDRGRPVDRYYIEAFLAAHAGDIHGRMLEVGEATYCRRFGGSRVRRADVVTAAAGEPADFVADLTHAPELPSQTFDGVICTQTLQLLREPAAAIATLERILKPGGVLLLTAPSLSRLEVDPENRWLDRWRFTRHGLRDVLESAFEPAAIEITAYGNVLTSIAFCHGLADDELTADELDHYDPRFDLLVAARAVKSAPSRS